MIALSPAATALRLVFLALLRSSIVVTRLPTCRWNGLARHPAFGPPAQQPLIRTESLRTKVSVAGKRNFFSTGSFAMGALWRASGKRYFSPPRPTPSNRVFSTTVSVAGKRIFEGRDKEPERASKVQERRCGDRISLSNPPIQGLFDENREISVRTRMRGGGCSRHRTSLLSKFPANREIYREFS